MVFVALNVLASVVELFACATSYSNEENEKTADCYRMRFHLITLF